MKLLPKDKVLILGATGFIGRHLVARCLRETPHVVCLGTGHQENALNFNVETINLDLRCRSEVKDFLYQKQFDYVFNLAGYIDHSPYWENGRNVIDTHFTGVLNIIEYLDRSRLKGFVQVGSSDEYGAAKAPQNPLVREQPFSAYSFAKVAATHFLQMLALGEKFPATVVRLFLVYGPGQREDRMLPFIIKKCIRDEEFGMTEANQLRDFCYISDVVDALVCAAVSPNTKGDVLNVGSGVPISIRQITEKVRGIIGKGRPLWGVRPYRAGESMELYADLTMTRKMLDWSPQVSLETGLVNTISHYDNQLKEGGV